MSNSMAVEIQSILLIGNVQQVGSSLRAALGHEDETWQIPEARVGWFWSSRSHPTQRCTDPEVHPATGTIMRPEGLQESWGKVDLCGEHSNWCSYSEAAGIDMARYSEPDVIIVSEELPNRSCDEVCRQIRASSSAPILVISESRTIDELCRLLLAGADCYVHESVGPLELWARIRSLVRRSQSLKATACGRISAHLN